MAAGFGFFLTCFNGATAVKPWRENIRVAHASCNLSLQRGHGGKAVEGTHTDNPVTLPFRRCFNGATAVKPWRGLRQPETGAA